MKDDRSTACSQNLPTKIINFSCINIFKTRLLQLFCENIIFVNINLVPKVYKDNRQTLNYRISVDLFVAIKILGTKSTDFHIL
jgi:hypothetical protein